VHFQLLPWNSHLGPSLGKRAAPCSAPKRRPIETRTHLLISFGSHWILKRRKTGFYLFRREGGREMSALEITVGFEPRNTMLSQTKIAFSLEPRSENLIRLPSRIIARVSRGFCQSLQIIAREPEFIGIPMVGSRTRAVPIERRSQTGCRKRQHLRIVIRFALSKSRDCHRNCVR
jgi:hypothetical protein